MIGGAQTKRAKVYGSCRGAPRQRRANLDPLLLIED